MSGTVLFNVRVAAGLLDAIENAAAEAGLKKSVWAREVLAAVAVGGVTLEDLRDLVQVGSVSPHPARYLALQGQSGRSEGRRAVCSHPSTAIQALPFTDLCRLCGATVKHR